jgi:hypothetical protein
MNRLAFAALAGLFAAGTVAANAPPPQPEPGSWRLGEGDVLMLEWGTDDPITLTCAEGKKTLEVYTAPAWETGYTMENGKVFEGPLETVVVSFGKTTFEATLVPKAPGQTDDDYFPTYTLPANADTVTAVMLADNMTVTLKADGQVREATPDTTGAFDMFATTCAQINGLR